MPSIPPWDATQFNKERRSGEEKCDVEVSWRSRARWKWELSLPLLSALFNVNFAIDWRGLPGFPPNFPRHPVSYSPTSIQRVALYLAKNKHSVIKSLFSIFHKNDQTLSNVIKNILGVSKMLSRIQCTKKIEFGRLMWMQTRF